MAQFAALQERPYDLIVYGATGYIGSLIARYLTAHAPTTLSWAVAGRSQSKLYDLQADLRLRTGGQDRKPPGIIKASLNQSELKAMVSQARVLLNTVGVRPSVPLSLDKYFLFTLNFPSKIKARDDIMRDGGLLTMKSPFVGMALKSSRPASTTPQPTSTRPENMSGRMK